MSIDSFKLKLGRVNSPDPRDKNFLIKDKFSFRVIPQITSKYWDANGWWGDQLNTPHCVGYAWAHWIEDGPISPEGIAPIISPSTIYENAQKLDEWPGENYTGTSVRGGVKYLKSIGRVISYYWAFDIDTISKYVLTTGPLVVGTDWYRNMITPNKSGWIYATGGRAGGHAYVINGVDTLARKFRIKNSWGKGWGIEGHAWIGFSDFTKLLRARAEACVAIENPNFNSL